MLSYNLYNISSITKDSQSRKVKIELSSAKIIITKHQLSRGSLNNDLLLLFTESSKLA